MPANQTLTISKAGANWSSSSQAVSEFEGAISDEIKAWYTTAKNDGDLTDFTATLADSDTLVITRTWTDDGWAAMSARKDEAATIKSTLEAAGFSITDIKPDYV